MKNGTHTLHQVNLTRARLNEEPYKTAYEKLIIDADEWLKRYPKPDRKINVYNVYEGGDVNGATIPESEAKHEQSKENIIKDIAAAYCCAVAYILSGENAYADKTIQILNAWANINKGREEESQALEACVYGVGFINAAELVYDYEGWSDSEKNKFKWWLESYFYWDAKNIIDRTNNWGSWGVRTLIQIENYLGVDINKPHQNYYSAVKLLERKIVTMITDSTGELGVEMKRKKNSLYYTSAALEGLTSAVEIVRNVAGINFFERPDIKKALDNLWDNGLINHNWRYPEVYEGGGSVTLTFKASLFVAMGYIYGRQDWIDYQAVNIYGWSEKNEYGNPWIADGVSWVCPQLLQPIPLVAIPSEPVDIPPVVEPPVELPTEIKIVKIIIPKGVGIEIVKGE